MKKTLLIVVNVLLVALLCVSSFYLYKTLQNRHVAQFIKEQQATLLTKGKEEIQEGNIGHSHITACFPKDAEGKRIASVEKLIHQTLKESVGEAKPSGDIQELVFVSTSDMPTNIPSVRRTEVATQSYQVSGFHIQPLNHKTSHSILLTVANQPFSLADLLSNSDQAKSLFTERLKAELEAKQLAPDQVNSYLSAFGQLDLKTVNFTYEASKVTLQLPEEGVGLSQLTVDIASLFDVVNGEYLTEMDKKAYDAYQEEKRRKATEQMVALTFDDGPNPSTTPVILDILKKYQAKATFFILGQNIAGNEEIIKRIKAEGHEIANHSWSHPSFVTLSPDQVKQEVEQTQAALEQITGQRPTMVRPPYGAVNQAVMDAMNLPAMYWSVDSQDWQSRNPQMITNVIKANATPGSIILMHDIHQTTVDAVEPVVQYLQSKGYSMGTLSDLLGPNLDPKLVYYDRDSARPAQ